MKTSPPAQRAGRVRRPSDQPQRRYSFSIVRSAHQHHSPCTFSKLVRRQKAHPKDTPWKPTDYVFGTEIGARVVDIRTAWDTAVLKAHETSIRTVGERGSVRICPGS